MRCFVKVVKSQMDQEAEIIKQSRARQEAALTAAADDDEEDEPGEPIRTVSSGARGVAVASIVEQKKCLFAIFVMF